MAYSLIAIGFPLVGCPNNLLPDNGHNTCPQSLGIQHLSRTRVCTAVFCPCQINGSVLLSQMTTGVDCKKTLRDLPFVPGQLFGPNVPELLEKRGKLSEATRQLTQVQHNPMFRMSAVQTRHCYATLQQCSFVGSLSGNVRCQKREQQKEFINSFNFINIYSCS